MNFVLVTFTIRVVRDVQGCHGPSGKVPLVFDWVHIYSLSCRLGLTRSFSRTPIINSLVDVYGYLRFLKIRPWYDFRRFQHHIGGLEKKNREFVLLPWARIVVDLYLPSQLHLLCRGCKLSSLHLFCAV